MTREELTEASEVLEEAAGAAPESVRDRLREQAAQLADLADRDPGPDHGRLDRHQNVLRDIKRGAPEIAERIDRANELISSYRSTIEGV